MKIEKVEKLHPTCMTKKEYAIHIRNLKQALNHGLILKKVHRVIKFNQKVWLKLYIYVNTEPRKKVKKNIEKHFFKLTNNAVFGKIMGNLRKHRNIKLVITEARRNYLVSELNYHTTKCSEKILLHGYRQLYSVHKNRRHLCRHCERCSSNI